MNHPPRLGHLATRAVIAARLAPTYAQAHNVDDDEAREQLERALRGSLWERLLDAAWAALLGSAKRLTEEGLLEKVAGTLKDRPLKPGRVAAVNPAWSAFLVLADLEAGTASDAARRVLESAEGQRRAQEGIEEVGRFLAGELGRGK
ncbi:MAG TPA: hypothetical protein VND93_09320 [Myxococcales bacterium]|nr:hypothetical protein [Myxococcales bacterium]